MAEIRKHYPPPEVKTEEPKPVIPEYVFRFPTPEEARNNTIKLVQEINKLINQALESYTYISYYYLYTEVFTAMKDKAMTVCGGNAARAARMLGIKGTTFREALRAKVRPKPSQPEAEP
jgi:DNA-binding protein Fis